MKLLTFALIIYLAYRVIIKPALQSLKSPNRQQPIDDNRRPSSHKSPSPADDEGEYIDYEEVE